MAEIGFIGLGKLGFAVATKASLHYQVVAYDPPTKRPGKVKLLDSIRDVVEQADMVFMANPDIYEDLAEVAKWCLYLEKPTTVVVISRPPAKKKTDIASLLNEYVTLVDNKDGIPVS